VVDLSGTVHREVLVGNGHIQAIGTQVGTFGTEHAIEIVDLHGAVVTAAFVDAHVHLTASGLLISGLDLRAVRSKEELIAAVAEASSHLRPGEVLIGHGWDETQFAVPVLPDADELERASGAAVYLTRIDVHSALVSRSLLAQVPHVVNTSGYLPNGRLTREAHGVIRSHVFANLSPQQRQQVQREALKACATAGIASIHEHAGPVVSSATDLQMALQLGSRPDLPEVVGYWGELHAADRARELGAIGAAGDLFIDGSLGSHTAHVSSPYADADGCGAAYVSADELLAHFIQCLEVGVQGGVHAIGDAAIASAVTAMAGAVAAWADRTESRSGLNGGVRAGQWRIEHLEMPSAADIARIARLGVIASVQPQFDALWGGPGGMYEQRLGHERAHAMNPFATLNRYGVALAFGSDSPVTPLTPWKSVAAAVQHHQVGERLGIADAFRAHTAGAADAAVASMQKERESRFDGFEGSRVRARLTVGEPADIAVWQRPHDLPSDASGWQILHALADDPQAAVMTMRRGVVIHDMGLRT
jgi:hypothetical protein